MIFLKIFLLQKIQIGFLEIFMILNRIIKGAYSWLSEHAKTRKHAYELSCSSVRVCMTILAHFV